MSDDYAIGYKGQHCLPGARVRHVFKGQTGRLILPYQERERGVVRWDGDNRDSALWTIHLECLDAEGRVTDNPDASGPPGPSDYAIGCNGQRIPLGTRVRDVEGKQGKHGAGDLILAY